MGPRPFPLLLGPGRILRFLSEARPLSSPFHEENWAGCAGSSEGQVEVPARPGSAGGRRRVSAFEHPLGLPRAGLGAPARSPVVGTFHLHFTRRLRQVRNLQNAPALLSRAMRQPVLGPRSPATARSLAFPRSGRQLPLRGSPSSRWWGRKAQRLRSLPPFLSWSDWGPAWRPAGSPVVSVDEKSLLLGAWEQQGLAQVGIARLT